jgi:hypothetical protein
MYYYLFTDKGKWATKDNSMIFANVVYLSNKLDALKYHIIHEDNTTTEINYNNINEYLHLEEL